MADEGTPDQRLRPGLLSTELGARIASAAILVAIALVATYLGGWLFAALWLAAGLAMVVEWAGMARLQPRVPVYILSAIALGASTAAIMGVMPSVAVPVVVLAVASIALAALVKSGRLWAIAALASATILVLVPPFVRESPTLGIVGILWMFAVVWTTDTAAYFTGRRLGGPKLWPRVSPKKTWSGFLGGLLGGTLAGLGVAWIATHWSWAAPVGLGSVALLSALSSIVSQGGDLAESALKRHFGVKDSGNLIPGHGGVMDRLDGFWAVAAFVGLILLIARSARPDAFAA